MTLPNLANIADVGDRLKTALSAGRAAAALEKNKAPQNANAMR